MASKGVFSNEHRSLEDVAEQHNDVEAALRQYFAFPSSDQSRFLGYSQKELSLELEERLAEEDHMAALSVLAAIEAAFRVDYLLRIHKVGKDKLSRAFCALTQPKRSRPSLEDDILKNWRAHVQVPPHLIGALQEAFHYRHWLAHGRYWNRGRGSQYDFSSVYRLAEEVFSTIKFMA